LLNLKDTEENYIQKIFVGNNSYGGIEVYMWGHENERIIIGNFVSIGSAKLICGGNHPYKGFSTFPFKVFFFDEKNEAETKGPIVIEDDVWIGLDVTILSGVTIGQGSVIASNSVVSKNVEPYSIVAGNPAKIVKYRFNEKIRKKMLEFDFSRLTKEKIIANKSFLYDEINDENYIEIFNKLFNSSI